MIQYVGISKPKRDGNKVGTPLRHEHNVVAN